VVIWIREAENMLPLNDMDVWIFAMSAAIVAEKAFR